MIKGRIKYNPPQVITELEIIKKEKDLRGPKKDSDAFRIMVKNSQVGRELEKMRDKFLMVDLFIKKKKRR